MGSGGPRELAGPGTNRKLAPELFSRLTTAVEKLDRMDADFKQARDDERAGQLAKAWGSVCVQINEHLREVAEVLIQSHQISLDMGSDGGGRGATPWIEETGFKFKRLVFTLQDDGTVTATSDGRGIARGRMTDLTYEWVERVVVEWVVSSIERLR